MKHSKAGFTLSEVLIAMAISTVAITCALGAYLHGLKTMYKDQQRLATNATLRQFLGNLSKKSLDSTEFLLFPSHAALNGAVDLTSATPDTSPLEASAFDSYLAHGDCLVLVTRKSTESTSEILRLRIYYRVAADYDTIGPIRLYEKEYAGGTASTVETLLNAIDLAATPKLAGSAEVVPAAIGRKNGATHFPIFSTESPAPTPVNASVAVNVEVVNGTTANNMLSTSTFNYIVSPRK